MANKSFSFITTGIALAVIAGLGGYYYSAGASIATTSTAVAAQDVKKSTAHDLRTSTMVLPGQTRNAWKMHDYPLTDINGVKHQLGDWKGKTILINFWASWCQPCQYEIPQLVALQKKYAEKGLQIVSYGLDDREKLKNVARTLNINYPILVVPQGLRNTLLKQWGNPSVIIPHSVVINKVGKIEYIHRGAITDDAIELYLLPLLKR